MIEMAGIRTLRRGDHGEAVRDIQARLAVLGFGIDLSEHGWYGPVTEQAVRAFQQRRQLMVDGVVGEETWEELVEAGYSLGDRVLYLRYPFDRGDDVRALQSALSLLGFDPGREDGILGDRTDRAVREFQRNVGLIPDGIVGSTTIDSLARLRPVGPGPGRAAVREGEALRRLSASLQEARIAIDAGHGGDDPGASGPAGATEAVAAYLLADALRQELVVRGANPLILRGPDEGPPPSERAHRANEFGAEILVAFHLNSHSDPAAEGCSTYYYGREGWQSPAGQRLAELVQDELTLRLHLKDGRTHAKALPLLRATRMPAVHVEPCFITNPREEALLDSDSFRREVARALAEGVERFFGRQGAVATAGSHTVSLGYRAGAPFLPGIGSGPDSPGAGPTGLA
jgi:N-acetylmuramoyl-L-alanine amidase